MSEGPPLTALGDFELHIEGSLDVLRAMRGEIPGAVTACMALGGGANGVVATAGLKALSDYNLRPNILVGSSASAAPIMYYAANQLNHVLEIFQHWCVSHPFVNPRAFFKDLARPPADIDALCDVIRTGPLSLGQQAVRDSGMNLYVTGTNAETGEVEFLDVREEEDDLTTLVRISAGIPGASGTESVLYKGRRLTDGDVGDPLPVQALRRKFPEITHLLILPNFPETVPGFAENFIKLLFAKTNILAPAIRSSLSNNHARLQKSLKELRDATDITFLCPWPKTGTTTEALGTDALQRRAEAAIAAMGTLCSRI